MQRLLQIATVQSSILYAGLASEYMFVREYLSYYDRIRSKYKQNALSFLKYLNQYEPVIRNSNKSRKH